MEFIKEINIEEIIQREFESIPHIRLNIDEETHNIFYVTFVCTNGEETHFTIDLNSKEINISILSKCEDIKGKKILSKIISIAKKIAPVKITLLDTSKIFFENNDCFFDLAYFYILLKGISWYNSHGFISEQYETEIKENKKLCSMKLNAFFELCKESNLISDKNIEKHKKYIEDNKLSDNLKLSNYFKFLQNQFTIITKDKTEYICDNILFKLLDDIITLSGSFIQYDRELFMDVKKVKKVKKPLSINLSFLKNKLSMIV